MHGGPQSAIEQLEPDRDNVRAAIDWGLEQDPERSLGMAAALVEDLRHSLFTFSELRPRLQGFGGPSRRAGAGVSAETVCRIFEPVARRGLQGSADRDRLRGHALGRRIIGRLAIQPHHACRTLPGPVPVDLADRTWGSRMEADRRGERFLGRGFHGGPRSAVARKLLCLCTGAHGQHATRISQRFPHRRYRGQSAVHRGDHPQPCPAGRHDRPELAHAGCGIVARRFVFAPVGTPWRRPGSGKSRSP